MGRSRAAILVGVVVGLGLSVGRFPLFAGIANSLVETATRLEANLASVVIGEVSKHSSKWALVAALVLPVMAPGLVAFALTGAANLGSVLRRASSGILLFLGVAAFFVLPVRDAIGVAVFCFVLAGVTAFAGDAFITFPLAMTATLMAGTWLPQLVTSRDSFGADRADEVARLLFNSTDTTLARWVLFTVAVAPFVGALAMLWRALFDRTPAEL